MNSFFVIGSLGLFACLIWKAFVPLWEEVRREGTEKLLDVCSQSSVVIYRSPQTPPIANSKICHPEHG